MDVTFMTINDLTEDANIVFASDSVQDILGFRPSEILHKSAFDFFHPSEVAKARKVHSRGALLDKAAVLHTVHIRAKNGDYEKCECTFTIVQDVLIACVGLYQPSYKSERRAHDAPRIRQLFKCSPMDPMYHMLEQLSPKYQMTNTLREPRAVLILNRFTRTLAIMFASDSIFTIMGISAVELNNRSFYELIQETCLAEVISCLESAKANDSIAYLRFWYRDLRKADEEDQRASVDDDDETDPESDDNEPARSRSHTATSDPPPIKTESPPPLKRRRTSPSPSPSITTTATHPHRRPAASYPPPSSIDTSATIPEVLDAMEAERNRSHDHGHDRICTARRLHSSPSDIEIEAVVSCTSDGIAVVMRRARPPVPGVPGELDAGGYRTRVSTRSYGMSDSVYSGRSVRQ